VQREIVRVLSRRAPTLAWPCAKCHRTGIFECTELFRANANGKLVDIWLIYRCRRCDDTKKLTVVERTPVRRLPAGLLDAAQGNDPVVARRFTRNLALIRTNGVAVAEGDDWECIGPAHPLLDRPGGVELAMEFPEPLLVRLDDLLAGALAVSRSRLRKLVETGSVAVCNPGRLGALRLWSDTAVAIINS